MSQSNSFLQFLTVLILFAVVLAITYLTTRYIARYQKIQNSGKNMEVIDTCKIAPGKYVQIVRAGEKYIAVGIGKDELTMLCEIPSEQINRTDNDNEPTDFAHILQKLKQAPAKDQVQESETEETKND